MKINDASLVPSVSDPIQIPTGENGDLAISVGQLKDYISTSKTDVDSTTSVILDFSNKTDSVFSVSEITGNKNWSFQNSGDAVRFDCIFKISGGLYTQTFESNVKMNSGAQWDSSTKVWTPLEVGTYKMSGVFDGTYWYITIDDSIFE